MLQAVGGGTVGFGDPDGSGVGCAPSVGRTPSVGLGKLVGPEVPVGFVPLVGAGFVEVGEGLMPEQLLPVVPVGTHSLFVRNSLSTWTLLSLPMSLMI